MKTSNPFSLRRLEDTLHVLDGLVLPDTVADCPHARPVSLKTSFRGSMKTTAVSFLLISIVLFLPACNAISANALSAIAAVATVPTDTYKNYPHHKKIPTPPRRVLAYRLTKGAREKPFTPW